MTLPRFRLAIEMLLTTPEVFGCRDGSDSGTIAGLNRANAAFGHALRIAADRFEHADRQFGPSTNHDLLNQNVCRFERMQEASVAASQVEDSAIRMRMQSTPSTLRVALPDRVQHRYPTLMNGKRQIENETGYTISLIACTTHC